jgi:hypothetical protein
VLSAAACSIGPVELAGFDSKAPSPKPTTAAPNTPSGSPSLGTSDGPSLSGPAEKRSCADLTFSSQFRRLFQGGAKFAPPKREKVSGQGYQVACRIGPEDGQSGSRGFVEFKYVSGSKSKCGKEGLKADPSDAAGWYSEGKAEWSYTLCTASGNTTVIYHQGTDSKPANLPTVSRLAHLVGDGSWEIDAVLGQ